MINYKIYIVVIYLKNEYGFLEMYRTKKTALFNILCHGLFNDTGVTLGGGEKIQTHYELQWRNQDFPKEEGGGTNSPGGSTNIRFCQIFPKTA